MGYHFYSRHYVFLEIAIPTAMQMVTSDIQLINLTGLDWGQGQIRGAPFINTYDARYEAVHPFKLSKLAAHFDNQSNSSATDSCVYCNLIHLGQYWTNHNIA